MAVRSNIGRVYLQVAPSLQGFFTTMDSQLASSGGMQASGQRAGASLGGGITSGLKGVLKKIGGIAGIITGVGAGLSTVAAGMFTGKVLESGLNRALNIEDAKAKLKGLSYSATEIESITGEVLKSVAGTAYGLDSMLGTGATALASGIKESGLADYLSLVGDTATITGGSVQEIGSIFNKITGNGKLMTETMLQLADRGLPVLQWMAEDFGVTSAEMQKMVTNGEVSAERFRKVIAEKIGGAALESGNTARGSFANLLASFSRLGATIVGGSIPVATELMQKIVPVVDAINERLKPLAANFWETFGPKVSEQAGKFLNYLLGFADGSSKLPAIFGQVIPIVKELVGVFAGWQSILQGGLGIIIEQIGQSLANLSFNSVNLPVILSQIGQIVMNLATIFGTLLVALIPLLPPLVNLANTLVTALLPAIVAFTDFLAANSDSIASWIMIIGGAKLAFGGLMGILALSRGPWLALTGAISTATSFMSALRIAIAFTNPVLALSVGQVSALAFAWARNTAAMVAARVAALASVSWLGIITAAQWLWNTAMSANPIGLLIVGIGALIAGIVYLATKTQFFQTIWAGIVTGVKASITWLTGAFTNLGNFFMGVFKAIGEGWANMWNGIGNFFIGIINAVINGINSLIKLINNISIPIPEWAQEFFGTKRLGFNIGTISNIPALAKGGNVMGPTLALVGERKPETVTDLGLTNRMIANTNSMIEGVNSGRFGSGEVSVAEQQQTNIINVYPSENMDTNELADAVVRKLKKEQRR